MNSFTPSLNITEKPQTIKNLPIKKTESAQNFINNISSSSSSYSSSSDSSSDNSSSDEEKFLIKDVHLTSEKTFKCQEKITYFIYKLKSTEATCKTLKIKPSTTINTKKLMEDATKISIEDLLKIDNSVDEVVKKISLDLKDDDSFEVLEHGTINNKLPSTTMLNEDFLSFTSLPIDDIHKSTQSSTLIYDSKITPKRRGPTKKPKTTTTKKRASQPIFDDFDSDSMDFEAELLLKMREEESMAVLNLTDFGLHSSEQVNDDLNEIGKSLIFSLFCFLAFCNIFFISIFN